VPTGVVDYSRIYARTVIAPRGGMKLVLLSLVLLAACADHHEPSTGDDTTSPDAPPSAWSAPMGAHYAPDGSAVTFRVASTRASRIEVWIYSSANSEPVSHAALTQSDDHGVAVWSTSIATSELPATVFYGYRVWGPNWPYDAAWTPGSATGRIADVDKDGNRFNPNKLVFDPYAREITHDPMGGDFGTGDANRAIDSGPSAPKAIVLRDDVLDIGTHPARPLSDDVIYEVHLRGFTMASGMADGGDCAGTYAGAATRAQYLADLGVTAVEFLPLQETGNDQNDRDPASDSGDNYWGYSTLSYFAPDRRYACDRSPGGPTRELAAMVHTFHDHGIKVFVDVVYNHTAEGSGGSLYSLRGIDNAGYYQLDRAGTGFTSSNGVGADLAGDKPLTQALVLDSLHYWRDTLGVDGFRFDLAPVLGNTYGPGGFTYKPDFLAKIAASLSGTPLIAEPWGTVAGSYQLGNFPVGWSEWNGQYRDAIRQDQNQRGVANVTPGTLADRVDASSGLFRSDGRPPSASINFLVAHDGLTMRDLYACNASNNAQAWPYGPSNGGTTDNRSWDHAGDAVAQRQAARTGFALLMLSQGVPMIVGGDEFLRTQKCNNNPYNLDSPGTWLAYPTDESAFTTFARRVMQFRAAHAALRSPHWIEPAQLAWRDADGATLAGAAMDDATRAVIAWQLDGTALGDAATSIYVAYDRGTAAATVTLPAPADGLAWYRVADTGSGLETSANIAEPGTEYRMNGRTYNLAARSLALFIQR
jgi:glycogen operon protein